MQGSTTKIPAMRRAIPYSVLQAQILWHVCIEHLNGRFRSRFLLINAVVYASYNDDCSMSFHNGIEASPITENFTEFA